MRLRPPDKPCPVCGAAMRPEMASGGWAPDGFEPEYDHYWCDSCTNVEYLDEESSMKTVAYKGYEIRIGSVWKGGEPVALLSHTIDTTLAEATTVGKKWIDERELQNSVALPK